MFTDKEINFLAWTEDRDWSELDAGQRVVHQGRIWIVVRALGDDRYTLKSVRNFFERVNADRVDITIGYVQ